MVVWFRCTEIFLRENSVEFSETRRLQSAVIFRGNCSRTRLHCLIHRRENLVNIPFRSRVGIVSQLISMLVVVAVIVVTGLELGTRIQKKLLVSYSGLDTRSLISRRVGSMHHMTTYNSKRDHSGLVILCLEC